MKGKKPIMTVFIQGIRRKKSIAFFDKQVIQWENTNILIAFMQVQKEEKNE
jgi:hypothetical protein